MDALAMQETGTCEYKSKRDGAAHMCGHDAHMSMLLIAAKVLAGMKVNREETKIFTITGENSRHREIYFSAS